MFYFIQFRKNLLVVLLTAIFPISNVNADKTDSMEHAPIGVMGDHTHDKGEVMFSYRHSYMDMEGNRDGQSGRSAREVLSQFVITPLKMSMDMDMFGVMYGVTDKMTVMAMIPYVRKSMDHINRPGVAFTTRSRGWGDAKIQGIWNLWSDQDTSFERELYLKAGISLPTGDTNVKDNTPLGRVRLPYPMQLGSGTYDPMLGITYKEIYDTWSWGGQVGTTQRIGHNRRGYRLGDEYNGTLWGAYALDWNLSASLRVAYTNWDDIDGRDKRLPLALRPGMAPNPIPSIPTVYTNLRGGERADLLAGLNWVVLNEHRISFEVGAPVYQHLDGPQLETDWRFVVGWQKAY